MLLLGSGSSFVVDPKSRPPEKKRKEKRTTHKFEVRLDIYFSLGASPKRKKKRQRSFSPTIAF